MIGQSKNHVHREKSSALTMPEARGPVSKKSEGNIMIYDCVHAVIAQELT